MNIKVNEKELMVILQGLDKYINDCLESAANADQLKSNILSAANAAHKPKVTERNKDVIVRATAKYNDKERRTDKYRNIHESRRWEPDEVEYLKAYYKKDDTRDIAEHLHRSRCAVRQKALVLGISENRK